jgi:hypothetical protein
MCLLGITDEKLRMTPEGEKCECFDKGRKIDIC